MLSLRRRSVQLIIGSNVVTRTTGNCGGQESDFAAYDVSSGQTCPRRRDLRDGARALTNSAAFPADRSQTDPVSYCYLKPFG